MEKLLYYEIRSSVAVMQLGVRIGRAIYPNFSCTFSSVAWCVSIAESTVLLRDYFLYLGFI